MIGTILILSAAAYVGLAALELALMRGPYVPDLQETDALLANHQAEQACIEVEERAVFEESRSR